MLGRALAIEWMSRVIFLEAAICVAGNISAYVGEAIPASAYTHDIGEDFKKPVIIQYVSFRAISTCPVCLDRPHEEQANLAVEKKISNAVVRTVEG